MIGSNLLFTDIDRFFETKPGIIICRNELATQLSRPGVYVEQDDMIAHQLDGNSKQIEDEEKGTNQVTVEKVEG